MNDKTEDKKTINYCFWAKLLVAIPLYPIVAVTAALQFHDAVSQSIAAVVAVIVVTLIARWIDNIPALNKKVISK
ncbi:MAG: hypothetical protein AB7L92_09220 [Alphaproteobacteria bacterium]